jgi:hypothetical protein
MMGVIIHPIPKICNDDVEIGSLFGDSHGIYPVVKRHSELPFIAASAASHT